MALDRTWYNSLVDDDGSGLTGSVWDKADVNELMLAINAELARIAPAWQPYTPTLSAAAGVWSSATANAMYRCEYGAQQLTVLFAIDSSTLSAPTTELRISTVLPLAPGLALYPMNPCSVFINGAFEAAHASILPSRYTIDILRTGNQAFPAGAGLFVRGQIVYPI
jgi:hypothetical protein